jgi:hypothetical protein
MKEIEALIEETERWRLLHKKRFHDAPTRGLRHGAAIEASACAIRLVALRECLELIRVNNTPSGALKN